MTSAVLDLREEWADLLERRASFAEALEPYGTLVERWATLTISTAPLGWGADDCRQRWERGVPLLPDAPPDLSRAAIEEVLGPVMETVAVLRPDLATGLHEFADAWDRGSLGPEHLFPGRGRIGSVPADLGLDESVVAVLATASLRPFLAAYFSRCRGYVEGENWAPGCCPLCGAPAGFSEVLEDGRRRLLCHLCGGAWIFARLRCPFCGTEASKELVRLLPDRQDEGYVVAACRQCQGYVKELDRRVRWNGRSGLVEDWGSPHLDLIARRLGYWRPVPLIIDIASTASG